MTFSSKEYGLIVALDIEDRNRLLHVVESTKNYVTAYKIGWPSILSHGPKIIEEISLYAPVICDFKIADIPEISGFIARKAYEYGASGVIVHAFVGPKTVSNVIQISREFGGYTFVLIHMTHKGAERVFNIIMDNLIEIVAETSPEGVVAPATRIEVIRKVRERLPEKIIISPGVGVQGGKVEETIRAGTNYIIVGRSIYESENPGEAAKNILEIIKRSVKKKESL